MDSTLRKSATTTPKKKSSSGGMSASHLLNFHTATNPDEVLLSQHSRLYHHHHGSSSSNSSSSKKKKAVVKSAAEKRTRENLSIQFYLYSSPIHGFVLWKEDDNNVVQQQQQQRRMIPDWSNVCAVRCLMDMNDPSFCPICLEEDVMQMMAPRIGKCGHVFCYPCILRHLLVDHSTDNNNNKNNKKQQFFHHKCPCCAHEMDMEDLRPVFFVHTCPPKLQQRMQFTKLVRKKQPQPQQPPINTTTIHTYAPQFPFSDNHHHKHQHNQHKQYTRMPLVSEQHAKFFRWNRLDPSWYIQQIIHPNISSIQKQITSSDPISKLYLQMALQSILQQQQQHSLSSLNFHKLHLQDTTHDQHYSYNNDDHEITQDNPNVIINNSNNNNNDCDKPKQDADATCTKQQQQQQHRRGGKKKNHRDDLIRAQCHHYLPSQDWTHFYQSSDGQLCFLSGFNMNCLANDFSVHPHDNIMVPFTPNNDNQDQEQSSTNNNHVLPPFPNVLEGIVLSIESVHVTQEVMKRMPFTSHLPLYTDILFCELDLNHWLCPATKQKFKHQMEQRKKKRQSTVKKEKKETRIAKQKEKHRIQQLLQMQQPIPQIDPNDEFFHALPFTDQFGPSLPTTTTTTIIRPNNNNSNNNNSNNNTHNHMSFRSVCASNGVYPDLRTSSNQSAFPALSSAATTTSDNTNTTTSSNGPAPRANHLTNLVWGRNNTLPKSSTPIVTRQSSTHSDGGKKKTKGKKIVLFSTGGGHRTL